MEYRKKVGILGGTFNPIHNGHIEMAKKAYEEFGLDYVLIMPSGNSYLKQHVLDTGHRVEMVRCAIKDYPFFKLSLVETNRSGNTYTYETLQELTAKNPDTDYYFILGADSLMYIDQWKCPEIIFSDCSILCAVREGYDMDSILSKIQYLEEKMHAKIFTLNMPQIDISSTMIRENAAKHQSIAQYVPKSVEEYIIKEHLYEEN